MVNMEDWIETELGEICEIISGKNQKNVLNLNGKYPIYGSGGIMGYADDFLCPSGTTIIGRKGTINTPIFVNQKFWNVDTAFGFNAYEGLHKRFLFYFCQGFNFKKLDKSTTIPSLAKRDLLKIEIPFPPLPIQRAIVQKLETLLTNLDNGIAQLKKAEAQLKIYRQAVLKKAFEGELSKEWRTQQTDLPTAETLLQQIKTERQKHYDQQIEKWKEAVKDWEANGKEGRKPGKPKKLKEFDKLENEELDELEKLPSNWAWVRLGENIGELTQGWSPKCENTASKLDEWGVIKTSAIQEGYFIEEENKTLPKNLAPKVKHELKNGDILITRAGPRVRVGVCCLIKNVRSKLINCDKAYRIRTIKEICKPSYLSLLLNSSHFKGKIEKIKSGISDSGLNIKQDIFLQMETPICSLKEQTQIVQEIESRLSVCDNLSESIQVSLQKAKALRQSILKKAFEGRLLSEEELAACRAAADYEPASVLLERIKAEKAKREAEEKAKKKRKTKGKNK